MESPLSLLREIRRALRARGLISVPNPYNWVELYREWRSLPDTEGHLARNIPAARLQPRERKVLLLRFGGELTQDEIARRIGVSQMHVSRILRNATAAPELQ